MGKTSETDLGTGSLSLGEGISCLPEITIQEHRHENTLTDTRSDWIISCQVAMRTIKKGHHNGIFCT